MNKIIVVDDHELVREGLKQVINETGEFAVVDEACNEREALSLVRKSHYDIMILDISLEGRNGLRILKELKDTQPELRVLIFSMHEEDQYAIQAIKAGAYGYLTKSKGSVELISALRKIALDKIYFSEGVSEQLVHRVQDPSNVPAHDTLSLREFQVFLLIAEGMSIKEIANELAISSNSVSTHRSRLLKKMNLKTNADIIRYAFRNGFID